MHAMPPRITRNSDRPRASNRTMVDTQIPSPLAKFKTRLASSPPEDESHGNGKQAQTILSSKSRGALTGSGLDLETEIFSASGRGRTFFLTSLFIELIEEANWRLVLINAVLALGSRLSPTRKCAQRRSSTDQRVSSRTGRLRKVAEYAPADTANEETSSLP